MTSADLTDEEVAKLVLAPHQYTTPYMAALAMETQRRRRTMRDLATKAEGLRAEHYEADGHHCPGHPAYYQFPNLKCNCGKDEDDALLDEIIAELQGGAG